MSESYPVPPIGTAIQLAADRTLALIEEERNDASYASRQELLSLQRVFRKYEADFHAAHHLQAINLATTQQELHDLSRSFAEYRDRVEGHSANASHQQKPWEEALALAEAERDNLRAQLAAANREAEAHRHAEGQRKLTGDLKAGLEKFGIIYHSEDAISFGDMWGSVLTELGLSELGALSPDELKVTLNSLAMKLQMDRVAFKEMEGSLRAAQLESQHVFQKYEVEIADLRLRIATLESLRGVASSIASAPQAISLTPQEEDTSPFQRHRS